MPADHRSRTPRASRILGVALLVAALFGILAPAAFATGGSWPGHGGGGGGDRPTADDDHSGPGPGGEYGHGHGGHGGHGGDGGGGGGEPPVVTEEVPVVVVPVVAVEVPTVAVPGLPVGPSIPPPTALPAPVVVDDPRPVVDSAGDSAGELVPLVPLRLVAGATDPSRVDADADADERSPDPGRPGGGPEPTAVVPSAVDPPFAPFVPADGLGWGIVAALAAAAVAGFVVRHATLRGAIRDAQRSATRDPLTGLANRRLFDEILARELVRGRRRAVPLALLLVDLDGFKRVNDTRGHAAGDEVLRTVAETLDGRVRGSDLPARLGGDEFAVVLPECAVGDAQRIAEELRVQIGQAVGPAVTASVGVAGAPDHGFEAEALVAAADAALYRAKAAGRDRVVLAEPGTTPAA